MKLWFRLLGCSLIIMLLLYHYCCNYLVSFGFGWIGPILSRLGGDESSWLRQGWLAVTAFSGPGPDYPLPSQQYLTRWAIQNQPDISPTVFMIISQGVGSKRLLGKYCLIMWFFIKSKSQSAIFFYLSNLKSFTFMYIKSYEN